MGNSLEELFKICHFLAKRKNPNYIFSHDCHWCELANNGQKCLICKCLICNIIVSHEEIEIHGRFHLKQHNLLPFI